MKNHTVAGKDRLYLGVDVGGTKVQASLVRESGGIVQQERRPTPRTGGPEQVLAVIEKVIDDVLKKAKVATADLTALGIAIPGVVDPDSARVVVTPNMSLTGVAIGAHLEGRFHVPVAVGNDGNLGTLGETWLGSARQAPSAVGIWVGTGIGAGFVQKGRLWRGARESAGEIGHIVMQIGGPKCGCGNRGCLEALASRSAIERDIREALAAGRTSVLAEPLRRQPERHPQRHHPPHPGGRRPPGHRGRASRLGSAGPRLPDRPPLDRPGGRRPGRRRDRGLQRLHDADH